MIQSPADLLNILTIIRTEFATLYSRVKFIIAINLMLTLSQY